MEMNTNKILISQQTPLNIAPYTALSEKFGVTVDFRPFFLIEPLSSKEFRTQRVNIPDYTAVVFSSRHAIDAYFKICEEIRFKVPETMKYFCTTEAVAMYLQKHIVFRKRKIFFGTGTIDSIIELIGAKHKEENFLITTADTANNAYIDSVFTSAGLKHTIAMFVKSVPQDLKDVNLKDYDMVVFYNPHDVESLKVNFPDFKQGKLLFASYGKGVVKAMEDAGLSISVQAPTPEAPSVAKALELFLSKNI